MHVKDRKIMSTSRSRERSRRIAGVSAALTAVALCFALIPACAAAFVTLDQQYARSSTDSVHTSITGPLIVGPAFTGTFVAWTQSTRTHFEVHEAASPGAAAVVGTVPIDSGGDEFATELMGSPTRLVLDVRETFSDGKYVLSEPVSARIFAGAPGQPLTPFSDCVAGTTCPDCVQRSPQSALSGDALAWTGACPYIEITDLSNPAIPPVRPVMLAPTSDPASRITDTTDIALAGNFLAAETCCGPLVIYDRTTGRQVYEPGQPATATQAPAGLLMPPVLDGAGWALESDGAVVAGPLPGGSPWNELVWASPAAPAAHVLSFPGSIQVMGFADDRIVVALTTRTKQTPVTTLEIVDLGGHATPIARVPFVNTDNGYVGLVGSVAFNGHRAAWAEESCDVLSIEESPNVDAEPPPPIPHTPDCGNPTVGRYFTVQHRSVLVTVTCTLGCRGTIAIDSGESLVSQAQPSPDPATARHFAISRRQRTSVIALRAPPPATGEVSKYGAQIDIEACRGPARSRTPRPRRSSPGVAHEEPRVSRCSRDASGRSETASAGRELQELSIRRPVWLDGHLCMARSASADLRAEQRWARAGSSSGRQARPQAAPQGRA